MDYCVNPECKKPLLLSKEKEDMWICIWCYRGLLTPDEGDRNPGQEGRKKPVPIPTREEAYRMAGMKEKKVVKAKVRKSGTGKGKKVKAKVRRKENASDKSTGNEVSGQAM